MSKERILVVEEDPKIQRLLQAQLLARDYVVQVADRGDDAIIAAAEFEPHLILLAMALPGIDGMETAHRLREWSQTPIIVLNGETDEHSMVEALDAGADDYVIKPFSMAVLLARMQAVLRRTCDWATPRALAAPLTFRNLSLDLVNRRVLLDGQTLHLTPTEYEMLRVLVSYAGRVLTHRELLSRVWGPESSGETQYLHVFISQLRRKLEHHAQAPRHILTEAGVGYQFSAEP